jgi:hypothetical protein
LNFSRISRVSQFLQAPIRDFICRCLNVCLPSRAYPPLLDWDDDGGSCSGAVANRVFQRKFKEREWFDLFVWCVEWDFGKSCHTFFGEEFSCFSKL